MRRLLVAGVVAAVCVACGGGGTDDDAGAASDGAVEESDGAVEESDGADTASDSAAAASGSATDAPVLTIADFAFAEVPTVAAGEELVVENTDGAAHTVTADDGSFDVNVGGGESATLTVDAAGSYDFTCTIHPSMTATLTVEG